MFGCDRAPEMSLKSPIFNLPSELLEQIIIASATVVPPFSIAALSETCKFLYFLIYKRDSTDHHLWRGIFLATFDDPRPALKHLTIIYGERAEFGWEYEFKARMRAAQVIRRSHTCSPSKSASKQSATSSSECSTGLLDTLRTLLFTITTSAPFPSTTMIYFGPLPTPVQGTTPFVNYPAFPPLVLLLCSSSSGMSDKPQPRVSHLLRSSNAKWLEGLLSCGFSALLTRRLLVEPNMFEFELEEGADMMDDGSPFRKRKKEEWEEEDETVKLFYKLVAHTGFIPITDPTQDGEVNGDHNQDKDSDDSDTESTLVSSFTPSQTSEHATNHSISDTASPQNSDDNTIPSLIRSTPSPTPLTHPSADEQFASARRKARRIVYDLRFLKPERHFGPFIFNRRADAEGSSSSSRPRSRDVNHSDEDDTDSTYSDAQSNSDSDEDDTGDDLLFPLVNLINMLPNTEAASEPAPTGDDRPFSPHSLKPDWTWLAGARIIVEANLRDMLRRAPNINPDMDGAESDRRVLEEVGNALRRMEGLRMGGAPGFWRDWGVMDGSVDADAGDEVDDKRKGKGQESGEGKEHGWDWAGVEGTWRRCICWLDYRDLLINNLQFASYRFSDDNLEEALRIFPMTLRISEYSWPSTEPALCSTSNSSGSSKPRLPVIHVEGEMAGLEQEPVRYIKGTVSMIDEGAVRWSLTSSRSGEAPPEWSTEGVQIGGVGSALGVIGLWTGAEHQRTDPLGPFWLWKVA